MNSETKSNSQSMGIAALIFKLGPKFLKFVPKIFKSLFSFKAGLGVASTFLYSSTFHSWIIGIGFVLAMIVHEYGHLWAMKKCGIRSSGMYLIPGMGAVIIPEDKWKSASNEAYIAIMGPVFGTIFFVVPLMILYTFTNSTILAFIAGIAAFINLFNLFPVNPLDGGRMMKTFVYSLHEKLGFFIMLFIGLSSLFTSYVLGFGLISFVIGIGLLELFTEFGVKKMLEASIRLFFLLVWSSLAITLIVFIVTTPFNYWKILISLIPIGITINYGYYIFTGKIRVDIRSLVPEWKNFRLENIRMQDDYPPLTKTQFCIAVGSYLALGVGLILCYSFISSLPDLIIFRELIK